MKMIKSEKYYKIYCYKFLKKHFLVFTEIPCTIAIDEDFYRFLKNNNINNIKDVLTHNNATDEYRKKISEFISELEISSFKEREAQYEDYSANFENYFDVFGIWLGITHECNLNCAYCYEKDGVRTKKQKMTLPVAKKAIDFLVNNSKQNVVSVIFFGGEPLIEFELIYQVVQYCKSLPSLTKKFNFGITTNATLLDQEKLKYLKSNNFHITISLDGDKHSNAYRLYPNGTESYSAVYDNIKNAEFYSQTVFRSTLTNISWNINKNMDYFRNIHKTNKVIFTECDKLKFVDSKTIKKLKQSYLKLFNEAEKGENSSVPLNCYITAGKIFKSTKIVTGCTTGINYFYISPDGKIYPCNRVINHHKEIIFGDLDNGINVEIIKKFRDSLDVNNNLYCKKCWCKFYCGGGCYGEKLESNDSYIKPVKQTCNMTKFKLKSATFLLELEMLKKEKNEVY